MNHPLDNASLPHLVFVGFMGVGKTTVGRRCAARLGYRFVDSDAVIEQRVGGSVANFFAEQGEAAFRKIEREVIAELAALNPGELPRVIATGGGVVLNPDNIEALRRGGIVILLTASPGAILRRVGNARSRPLLAGAEDPRQRVLDLLRARSPFYHGAAQGRVDTTRRSVDAICDDVIAIYRQRLEASGRMLG